MSKLKQLGMWAVMALVPFALAAPVSAQSTCQIGFTGPNSNNECTSTTEYVCKIKNDTTVSVDNENVQIAVSGNASGSGNTSSGDVKTGSATNSNNVTFTATVTNPTTCNVVATVPATQVPVGGSGAAGAPVVKETVRPAGGAGAAVPTVLANTGSAELLPIMVGMLGVSAAVFVAAKMLASSYEA